MKAGGRTETKAQAWLSGLAQMLDDILQGQTHLPGTGPFPVRREYVDSLVAYATALRVQGHRRQPTEDTDADWPSSVWQLRKQAGTLGPCVPESPILGIEIPPSLTSAEWQAKYAPRFLKYTVLGRAKKEEEEKK